jgi:uncharacterized protein YpuA (DUF1002 family)
MAGFESYGIERTLVERVKQKMKRTALKERVKMILNNVTQKDLQDRQKVNRLLQQISRVLGEKFTEQQTDNIISFVIAQKIDPSNTFHLIKLWGMFR